MFVASASIRVIPVACCWGTSSGQMYVSEDQGRSWEALRHFGEGLDYVWIASSSTPADAHVVYVAVLEHRAQLWRIVQVNQRRKELESLAGIKGKSIRSFAIAPSQTRELVAGALDGIFRSQDAGRELVTHHP